MEQKNKTLSIAAIILAVVSFGVSIASFCAKPAAKADDFSDAEVQYVMYVGTNDKDTYKPEHTEEEAKKIVDQICLSHFEGYTLQEATGAWTDEKNNITHEYTLVCYFDGADKETVYAAADEIREKLNQNSVLIEEDQIKVEYYGGK